MKLILKWNQIGEVKKQLALDTCCTLQQGVVGKGNVWKWDKQINIFFKIEQQMVDNGTIAEVGKLRKVQEMPDLCN